MAAERQPPAASPQEAYPLETRATDVAAESLTLLLGRAADTVRPKVSPAQLRALQVVEWHRSINLTGLAEVLGAIPSSASRLCDRLEAAGLLERRSGAHDRREIELVLSPDGTHLLARLREARRADLGAVLSMMSRQGRAALLRGLEEFAAAFGRRDSARGVGSGGRLGSDGDLESDRDIAAGGPPDGPGARDPVSGDDPAFADDVMSGGDSFPGGGRSPDDGPAGPNSGGATAGGSTSPSSTGPASQRSAGSTGSGLAAPSGSTVRAGTKQDGPGERRGRLGRDRGLGEQWGRGSSAPRGRRGSDGPGHPRDGSPGARPGGERPETEQPA
ncbi:DNA-binding MarR family transcriptional regulator [Actinoalloteichus hoggarensis]|uniref:Putative HTH-type transcriptional regulator YusO n=1 Tax=Actinoalloteichus hoggarensis TaxID=1470176 RepID=A0A221W7Z3_9PSEU|nr:MarR family transcriptional regulator [Actinoalloteichus hoggarensis]ASO21884.1 putative HTH-type transcriptional regulator YusO [Actinoalloteichus hoggarensis]MBB5922481.1 DNA-binding MarR family transcriptional regulator [Actinoalloteichus hoggarensis]